MLNVMQIFKETKKAELRVAPHMTSKLLIYI